MVRNLLVAMGAMGALGMGTSGRTGSASVPQQSAVPTDDLPAAAGGTMKETHPWSQMTTTPVIPTGGQISFRTKTRNGIRGTVNNSVVTCLEIEVASEAQLHLETWRVIYPIVTDLKTSNMGSSLYSSPS